ncbi:hypothetical protein [Paenibacillus polymyxa]|uniref:hypothetical protein n=1 Tax=Paenibacillus polymyxa TaxID=1406 RepID=UPI00287FABB9|nr:hypothetical protein [Paenibacillus polymyxa]
MCEVLEEEVKQGNSKNSQLKVWNSYFDYEKMGNKFIIKKIYKKPKPFPDMRGGNRLPYLEHINDLLIQILLRAEGYKFILSKNKLLLMLNMINGKYNKGKDNIDYLCKYLKMDKVDIYDFYNFTDDTLKRNLESSLKDLKNKKAIFYKTVLMICKNNDTHRASDDEEEIVLTVQSRVLEDMGYKGLIEVFRDGVIEEFTEMSNQILFNDYGISYVFEAYDVTLNKDKLIDLKEINDRKLLKLGDRINIFIKDRLLDNTGKRVTREIERWDDGFGEFNSKTAYRTNSDYYVNQEKLIDIFVDANSKFNMTELQKSQ